jgi:DNA polymerase-3 subunit beta
VEVTPAGGATTVGRTIAGRYPDYRRVIPGKASGVLAQFDPRYLATLAKAHSALHGSKAAPYVGIGHNGLSGALLTLGDENFVGVLMPLRTDSYPLAQTAPTWTHDTTLATPAGIVDDLV